MLTVLLVGKGGREHALAWKLAKSPLLKKLYLWPEAPALSCFGESLGLSESVPFSEVCAAAKARGIDIVVSGPEAPLAQGLADQFALIGIPTFGPLASAALLESSKAFAKDVMAKAGIPTAAYQVVTSESECRDRALSMLQDKGGVVLKASGLAAGKGVFVCTAKADVESGLKHLYGSEMSQAASEVVLEEVLFGRECSYFVCLGSHKPIGLGFAVDHKRLSDGDIGPNTGGMGCYAPVPWLPKGADLEVHAKVVEPLLAELASRGIPYTGFLYVGIMWSPEKGPQVVEFNVRLGDPEAQVLSVYDDRDWLAVIAHQAGLLVDRNALSQATAPITHRDRAVVVVMASKSYPYGKDPAFARDIPQALFAGRQPFTGSMAFAASMSAGETGLKPGSGRVLTVVARAPSFRSARKKAYEMVAEISQVWPDAQWRRDIGQSVEMHDLGGGGNYPELILASASPRRESLLRSTGFTFRVMKPEVQEVPNPGEAPEAYVVRNAKEKGAWVGRHLESEQNIVISADTIVVLDGRILEKPRDQAHAREMLQALSGRKHEVLTGVSVRSSSKKCIDFVTKTTVEFKKLSSNEIAAYIRSGEPMDKAGAYGAQGIGAYLVKAISGSYTNVVGLPVAEVVACLQSEFQYDLWG